MSKKCKNKKNLINFYHYHFINLLKCFLLIFLIGWLANLSSCLASQARVGSAIWQVSDQKNGLKKHSLLQIKTKGLFKYCEFWKGIPFQKLMLSMVWKCLGTFGVNNKYCPHAFCSLYKGMSINPAEYLTTGRVPFIGLFTGINVTFVTVDWKFNVSLLYPLYTSSDV